MSEQDPQWERHNRDFNDDAIRNQQAMCEHDWNDGPVWGLGTLGCRRCNKVVLR